MNEENQKEKEDLEPVPYQGAYRQELDDEPEADTTEEDTQLEATPQAKTETSFVEKTESTDPEHDYKKRFNPLEVFKDDKWICSSKVSYTRPQIENSSKKKLGIPIYLPSDQ